MKKKLGFGKHAQRGRPPSRFVCTECKAHNCRECIDALRVVIGGQPLCLCTRAGHSGEPTRQQILDPETGDVHGPGLVVKLDGDIERH